MTGNDFNNNNNDDLSRRLADLGGDLTPVRMPGAAAARKRAAQRSRHQVLGSVAAGVIVAVGVIVFRSGVLPMTAPEPAQTPPSPAETLTTTPPTSNPQAGIPDGARLQAEDIWDEWPGDNPDPRWEPQEEPARPECMPDLTDLTFDDFVLSSFASTNDARPDWHVTQELVRTDNAAQEFESLQADVEACVPRHDSSDGEAELPAYVDKGAIQEVGAQAWLMQYRTELTASAGQLVTVSLVQQGDAISAITKWQSAQDTPGGVDHKTPVNAAHRMCTAMFGGTCVGEAEFVSQVEETDPPPSSEPSSNPTPDPSDSPDQEPAVHTLADEPFLTEGDINPVGNAGSDFGVSESESAPNPPETWCLDDPNAAGAESTRSRYWDNGRDAHVGETAFQFADTDDATNYLLDYTSIPNRCDEMNVNPESDAEVTDIGVVSTSSGDDAVAWSVFYSPPEADTSFFGAAIAQRDNIAVLLTFGAMSDPGNWGEYVSQRLSLALDKAIAD